jgi:RNA polymerase sigma factor (sigma-70 family)
MTEEQYITHVDSLRPLLLRVGREFFRNEEEAEDISQETLLRLWLLRDRLPEGNELRALALRIARNVCVSQWRRQQLRRHASLPMADAVQPAVNDDSMENAENNRLLQEALEHLTPSEHRLFRLRQESEMSLPLVASLSGMQPRSISAKLSAARRKIFEYIKRNSR